MRSRAWRVVLVIVLLGGGAGAALVGWTISRQIAEVDRSQRELSDRADRLLTTLDAVTTAQQAHVTASSQQDPARVSTLLGQLRSETEALRPQVRSIDGGRALQDLRHVMKRRQVLLRGLEQVRFVLALVVLRE